jgi:ABC-type uncharacterized transport system YnjBCD ATPase subunit
VDDADDDAEDTEVSIGLLMEIAQAHQQLAEAALLKLKEHIAGLDTVVREQIRQTLIDELRGVHFESQRAVESLRRVQKAADLRVLWWSVGIAALSAMVAAVVGYAVTHA